MSHRHIDVRYVAKLARLELTDLEVSEFQPQIEAILGHAESLSRLDTSQVANPDSAPVRFGKMRDDVPQPGLSVDAVILNAPDHSQGQIRVPKVVTEA